MSNIHFVTWPNGNIVEGSQTSVDERTAIGKTVMSWLPDQYFPLLDLFGGYSPARDALWMAMMRAGFKVHTLYVAPETQETDA